jgi:putative phage-type endonuclease
MARKPIVDQILKEYGIDDQRTAAWHSKRGEMLTASEIWKAFGDATASARHELMMSKLTPRAPDVGSGVGALIWGTRLEPIAKEIYMKKEGLTIVDTSCVKHPEYPFLGASPDGILITPTLEDPRYGKLIEIKCPISRVFTDETPVPSHYMHQMQMQMECTGLDECEYVEFQFKTPKFSEWKDTQVEHKSLFAVSDSGNVIYKSTEDTRDIGTWKREVLGETAEEYQFVYWALVFMRCMTVPRDPEWMPTHLPEMKSVWDDIVAHRTAGTLPNSPKDKGVLVL